MKTIRSLFTLLLLACTFLFTGCDPEKTRVIWSPDGNKAIVILNDGLHLCDPDGKLSPLLIPNISSAEWFADSQRVLVLRNEEVTSWKELTKLISDQSRKEILELAPKIRAEAMVYQGDWEKFGETLKDKVSQDALSKYLGAVCVYYRDQNDQALIQKMGTKWMDIAKAGVNSTIVQPYELTPTTAKPGPILLNWAVEHGVAQIRLSPTGKCAAVGYTTFEDAGKSGSDNSLRLGILYLASPDSLRPVADITSYFVDWTADGRYLVFARTDAQDTKGDGGDRARLGSISRVEIDDSGVAPADHDMKYEDLAGILYSHFNRVRCLKDGRILFSSAEIQLPATGADMRVQQSLFALDPAKQATVTNLIPRNVEPQTGGLFDYFEVSPDEKRISLLGPKGEVRVLTLATAEIKVLQEKEVIGNSGGGKEKMAPRIVPTWRNDEQLTFAELIENPAPDKAEARIVLTNVTSSVSKSLSDSWPRATTEGFLFPSPEPPATATAPAPAQ